MKILNLYAGLGGNRNLWPSEYQVTAVEYDSNIASNYAVRFPDDTVIIGDAHEFLLQNAHEYDFIWSSPPCQSYSRMIRSGRNRKPQYPDLKLYEEILFLQHNFKGLWVVENVVPYYEPLVKPTQKVGRHLFWANFDFSVQDVDRPKNFINLGTVEGSQKLKDWLGIQYEGNLYYGKNHDPSQVLRNAVHPEIGLQILQAANKVHAKEEA